MNGVLIVSTRVGVEQYHFAFRLETAAGAMLLAAKFAADKELNFDWNAAARVTQAIRDYVTADIMANGAKQ